jgi:O-methyltransferase
MILAAALTSDRRIWCCDSFEGMPIPTVGGETFSGTEDFSDLDYLAVSLEQVQENFQRYGLLSDRIQFLKGWFSDTLPKAPIKQIALLRLDGDLYESTRDALEPLYPKVSKGGFVIVDDYNSWDGCKKAVTEYREQHGITAPLIPIDNAAVYWRV